MKQIADSLKVLEKNGGDDETRTRDLCRDSSARLIGPQMDARKQAHWSDLFGASAF